MATKKNNGVYCPKSSNLTSQLLRLKLFFGNLKEVIGERTIQYQKAQGRQQRQSIRKKLRREIRINTWLKGVKLALALWSTMVFLIVAYIVIQEARWLQLSHVSILEEEERELLLQFPEIKRHRESLRILMNFTNTHNLSETGALIKKIDYVLISELLKK